MVVVVCMLKVGFDCIALTDCWRRRGDIAGKEMHSGAGVGAAVSCEVEIGWRVAEHHCSTSLPVASGCTHNSAGTFRTNSAR